MAVKKATTTDDLSGNTADSDTGNTSDSTTSDSDSGKFPEPVYGGPPAVGDTPTRAVGDYVADTTNGTDSGPEEPTDKPVSFTSPWGSKVTVSSEHEDTFTDSGTGYSK